MPYALQPGEDLAGGLVRIAGEQAKRGLESLRAGLSHDVDDVDEEAEDPWDEAVHDVRKRCKKIRAVARLCRDALDDDYQRINAAFRDTARILSDARDAWTLVETVDLLADRDDDDLLPTETATDIRRLLVQRYRGVRETATAAGILQQAHDALTSAAARITDWPLDDDLSPPNLRPSIKRVYKRGHVGWADLAGTIGDDPRASTGEWHDWRKRVKYLWYHVRLLEEAWPSMLGGLEDDLDDFADALGEDHDLAVLTQTIDDEGLLDPGTTGQLVGAAGAQRHALREDAALFAPLVYAEKPSDFADRISRYVQIAWG